VAVLFFFPLYAEKWLSGEATSVMDPAQEGAFLRLLCHQWLSKHEVPCSLPSDKLKIQHLSRLGKRWKTMGGLLLAQFEPVPGHPDRMRNPMLWRTFLEQSDRHEARVEAGRAGGFATAKRQQKPSNATSNASSKRVANGQHLELELKLEPDELQKHITRVREKWASFGKLKTWRMDDPDAQMLLAILQRFQALTNDGRTLKVLGEIAGALDGMHGARRTPEELRTNIGDYLINPDAVANAAQLRAYLYRDPNTNAAKNGAKPTAGQRAFEAAGAALGVEP
jgi:uncharacterized protein YdaU (DUF1376 family)